MTEEESVVTSWAFSAYGRPLEMVTSFRYLRRVISAADDEWPKVIYNLEKARAMWRRMMGTLSREGAMPQVSVFLKSRRSVGVSPVIQMVSRKDKPTGMEKYQEKYLGIFQDAL